MTIAIVMSSDLFQWLRLLLVNRSIDNHPNNLHSNGKRENYAEIASNCIQIEIDLILLAAKMVETPDTVFRRNRQPPEAR